LAVDGRGSHLRRLCDLPQSRGDGFALWSKLRWTPFFGQLGASDKVELGGWPRDRVVLIACWTASVFIGSVLKDRRLARSLGEDDRAYQARVPGYPGIPFGPLARLP